MLGISLALQQAKQSTTNVRKQLRKANIDEFVNEKSKKPRVIGTILIIANCSRGDKKSIIIKESKKSNPLTEFQ